MGHFKRAFQNLPNSLNELVTSAWQRDDVLAVFRTVAQNLPECGHVPREITLLDKTVWPDLPHDLVLVHCPATVRDQNHQNIENLGGYRDRFPVEPQPSLYRIESVGTEMVLTPSCVP